MKPTTKAGRLLALLSCLICSLPASAQALSGPAGPPKLGLNVPPPAVPLLAPRKVTAGTTLTEDGVFMAPATYNALKADYHWQGEAVALKNERLDQAGRIDTSTTQLLLQSQLETTLARAQLRDCAQRTEQWQTKYLAARAEQRPPLVFDRRLYLGGGIGLTVGVLGTAYLLWRFH